MKKVIPVYDICTLSEFKQEDILISRFAPYRAHHHDLHLAHKHTFYHLVLFTKGGGTHAIDFEQFTVRPYQIYFMIPGQVHSWDFEGVVDGYVINFSEQFFRSFLLKPDHLEQFSFFNGTLTDAVIDLPEAIQKPVIALFEQLVYESEANERMGLDMVRTLMLQVFILIGRLAPSQQARQVSPYNYTLLRNFHKLIDSHYQTLRLPKEYAELLYITPNHLNALCKDMLGLSAGEVIRNRIILEAKRLLINLELSIAEIAASLGFEDNSYFTKFFKKQTALTPEDFRKRTLKIKEYENDKLR
ncbi:helix-turn-helix transcriptional regulator [Mucilaginibacter daejeonensis]|uniref:AraC family transcriptional regulator n=1 Tax=Mucilaginibacter daejeonensis TaxID=398049 RepID=UPI001D175417|nr:helix-turn-helix transcriptional regulator [Mucilaginibacter daejeonensis]UEG53055.1 helix-turn-helix transcriptional regulator [Mucilaginibacter daejeonensis]